MVTMVRPQQVLSSDLMGRVWVETSSAEGPGTMIKDRDYHPNNIVALMVQNEILANKKKENILPRMMKAFAVTQGLYEAIFV